MDIKLTISDIEDCAVAQAATDNTWRKVSEYAADHPKLEDFDQGLAVIEDEFREKYFGSVEEAKTSAGKWKKTYKHPSTGERVYILPNAWQTAKSVARKALEVGIDPRGWGQTAVAKKAREASGSKSTTSSSQIISKKVVELNTAIREASGHLSEEYKTTLKDYIEQTILPKLS